LKKLLWVITGAGYKMREVFNAVSELRRELGLRVTTALTRAGREVARLYGILDRLGEVSPGGYYEEVFVDDPLRPVSRVPGRVMMGSYDAVAIAPATANTVAKIAVGIADTIATQVFAMAEKAGTPVVIMPSDGAETVEAELPCMVDADACLACRECAPEKACPSGAISRAGDGRAHVDLSTCRGCGLCASLCPHGAISCWRKVVVRCRDIDVANVEELRRRPGVFVVLDEQGLYGALRRLLVR